MARRNSDGHAAQARTERARNMTSQHLRRLVLISAVPMGGLALFAWAVGRWATALATRLLVP